MWVGVLAHDRVLKTLRRAPMQVASHHFSCGHTAMLPTPAKKDNAGSCSLLSNVSLVSHLSHLLSVRV